MANIVTTDELFENIDLPPEIKKHMATAMVAFTKIHVTNALVAAAEKATCHGTYKHPEGYLAGGGVNKDSILSAYPLENIK